MGLRWKRESLSVVPGERFTVHSQLGQQWVGTLIYSCWYSGLLLISLYRRQRLEDFDNGLSLAVPS